MCVLCFVPACPTCSSFSPHHQSVSPLLSHHDIIPYTNARTLFSLGVSLAKHRTTSNWKSLPFPLSLFFPRFSCSTFSLGDESLCLSLYVLPSLSHTLRVYLSILPSVLHHHFAIIFPPVFCSSFFLPSLSQSVSADFIFHVHCLSLSPHTNRQQKSWNTRRTIPCVAHGTRLVKWMAEREYCTYSSSLVLSISYYV